MTRASQVFTRFRMTIGQSTSVGVLSWLAIAPTLHGQVSVLTWHNDNARTGQNLQESILTPANVNVLSFGLLFVISVDGKVDAQPLYVPSVTMGAQGVHNVLYVVTEHDSAYAFDADNGSLLWHASLVGSGETPSDDHGCPQVTPEIGATATPVIDTQAGTHGTMYVVATSKDSSSKYHHRVHALDLTTGAEQFGGPMEVLATYAGSGAENTFNPTVHKERPGLLLLNGVVYTSWGSHCDAPSYAGWVIGYNETTLQQISVLNLVPNGSDGGVWNAGAGPAADTSGNIYLLTGNGTFDTTLSGGFPNDGDYGNAFVKLAAAGGSLRVVDYFTMTGTTSESGGDVDLGSGGALVLPPLLDSQGHSRNLAVGAGKDKHIYVVDRTNLGKYNSGTNMIYQDMPNALPGGIWSSPAWFNGTLYYGDVGGTLKAFAFVNGLFQTTPASQSTNSFEYPGTTPSISANGTSNGIVWAVENAGEAVLHAYDAGHLSTELYNSNQANSRDQFGAGNKYMVPTIVNGKVYVGTTNGVGVFGLISQVSPLSVTPNSGAGQTQTFSAVYTDPKGASDLQVVYLDFGSVGDAPHDCKVGYAQANNTLYLFNDANNGVVGSITLGSGGSLSNSQCTLLGGSTAATSSGNNLTVPLKIQFLAGYGGLKNLFALAQSYSGTQSNGGVFQVLGTWTPAPSTPGVLSVNPSSGSGAGPQVFDAVYSDTGGANDLQAVYLDFGSAGFAAHSCIAAYVPGPNELYLFNDNSTGALGPIALGAGGGAVSNSQCALLSGSSSASLSGTNLTVPFTIQFLAGYTGLQQIFGLAQTYAGVQSGGGVPTDLGTWTPATSTTSAVSLTPRRNPSHP
jgi:putative pyrroloquinoline-quinone-binding quinoprotein